MRVVQSTAQHLHLVNNKIKCFILYLVVAYRCCFPTLPTGHFNNLESGTTDEAEIPLLLLIMFLKSLLKISARAASQF